MTTLEFVISVVILSVVSITNKTDRSKVLAALLLISTQVVNNIYYSAAVTILNTLI